MIESFKKVKIEVSALNVWFYKKHVLKDISMRFRTNAVTSIMGPSGCGKTTLIRSLNRMNEVLKGSRTEGEVLVDGENVYDSDIDVFELRRRVGMVFQKPNPFPKSIFENVAFGLRIQGINERDQLEERIMVSLRRAGLWDEVKDRMDESAPTLSGGQQQRLCIARALAVEPEAILMDEPTSALDPAATARIETLIRELAKDYTVVIVTHNMQQAARVSDLTAFLYIGELIEYSPTPDIFENPQNVLTEKYITGEFG